MGGVRRGVLLLSVGLALSRPGVAGAEERAPLVVERGAGAEECPDADSLIARVAKIRGRATFPPDSSYEVGFTHTGDAFTAVIRSGGNAESQRTLDGHGPTCSALAQATAVTLALLFDAETDAAPEPPKPEPPKPEPPPKLELSEPIPIEPPRHGPRVDATAALGLSGLVAVLRPLSPALTGELGLRVSSWRMGLGVLWSPPQSLTLAPGIVRESLLAGTARVCLALTRTEELRLDLCSGLSAGVVSARASGFTRNREDSRPWLAVPLELSFSQHSGPVGLEVSAAAIGALEHQDFTIDHLGPAYESPRVSGMLSLRAVGSWPL